MKDGLSIRELILLGGLSIVLLIALVASEAVLSSFAGGNFYKISMDSSNSKLAFSQWQQSAILRVDELSEQKFVNARQLSTFIPQTITVVDRDGNQRTITTKPEFFPGEIIVKFQQGFTIQDLSGTLFQMNNTDCNYNSDRRLFATAKKDTMHILDNTYMVKLASSSCDIQSLSQQLSSVSGIIYAEPNHYYYAASVAPNDPGFSQQWHLDNQPLPDTDIDAPEAWDIEKGSPNVVVAVIDSGIDIAHPDLVNNIWKNQAEFGGNLGIDDDNNGYIDDIYGWNFFFQNPGNNVMDNNGHGTAVAGIIAATGNNNLGVTGVSWNSKLMAVKVLGNDGGGLLSDISEGVMYATDNNANIISMSIGGESSITLQNAITYAYTNGEIIIASSGNSNFYRLAYPAAFREVIAVGATEIFAPNQKAYFSSYGENMDIIAPGEDIYTTKLGGSYAKVKGTSFSAPIVSGAAALLLSRNPTLTSIQAENILKNTADDLGLPGYDQYYGYGKVNAFRAVNEISNDYTFLSEIDSPFQEQTIGQFAFSVKGTAQSPDFISYKLEWGSGASPATWNLIITGTSQKNKEQLGIFDSTGLPEGTYTLRLTAIDSLLESKMATTNIQVENLLNSQNPIELPYTAAGGTSRSVFFPWTGGQDILLENMDDDAQLEIIVGGDSYIKAFNFDGSIVPNWDKKLISIMLPGGYDYVIGALASGEIEGKYTGTKIVALTGGLWPVSVRVYNKDGTEYSSWPQPVVKDGINYNAGWGPALEDVDGDGKLEIFFIASMFGEKVFGYNDDGTFAQGWPADMAPDPDNSGGTLNTPNVAIGDLDKDGKAEILANNYVSTLNVGDDDLWVFDSNGNMRYRKAGESSYFIPPVTGDLNSDFQLEFIDNGFESGYNVIANNPDGSRKWIYPRPRMERGFAMGYLGPDLGISIAADHDFSRYPVLYSGVIHLLDKNSAVMPGWPFVFSTIQSSGEGYVKVTSPMVLADVTGDGNAEILFTTSSAFEDANNRIPKNYNSKVYAVYHDGTVVSGFPKIINGITETAPVVEDVNKDGNAEIVVKTSDFIYIFDTKASFGAKPWPMFQHDNQRTGRYEPCGDGIVTASLGEECDDGNTEDFDRCTSICKNSVSRWLICEELGGYPCQPSQICRGDPVPGAAYETCCDMPCE